jgi:enediyne biosynthesis protein E4
MKMRLLFFLGMCISPFCITHGEIEFADFTDSSGLGDFHELGYGTALIDYNRDGLLDIFVVGQEGQNKLFENLGNLHFENVTFEKNIQGNGLGWGVCFGDFNCDNYDEIYISRRDYQKNDLFVFENGSFCESALALQVDDPQGFGYAACFAPLTKDLSLDLVITNQAWPSGQRQSCRFFAGNIDLPFTNLTSISGIADSSEYWDCVSAADYDNDGDIDLLISAEPWNKLYNNNGNGYFSDASDSANINIPTNGDTTGYGITWGDYNNDGWLDVYISCWHEQNGRLYKNNGNGTFTDVTHSMNVGHEVWSHSVSFGDFNNDGWLDLYSVSASYGNKLYKNNQGVSFTEIGDSAGVGDYHWGCGLSIGDINRDGRLDIIVGHYADGADNPTKVSLYRNITQNNNNWVIIKINGFPPNPDAIGARVRVVAGGISQIREVSGGSGFGSQNMLPLHFGLGSATIIDSVIITYPIAHIPALVYTYLEPNNFYELPDIILDVASVAMLSPQNIVDCELPILPEIAIANTGNVDAINFNTICELSYDSLNIVIDSFRVHYLAVGDTIVINYDQYLLPQRDREYRIEGIVQLFGDQHRSNDTTGIDFITAFSHDIICGPVLNPISDTLILPLTPKVIFSNRGLSSESIFTICCSISLWDSTINLTEIMYNNNLSPNSIDSVEFEEFHPTVSGRYAFHFNTMLANDRNSLNDSISIQLDLFMGNCNYKLGDINGDGVVDGLDLIYGVNFFRGGNHPPYECLCGNFGFTYIAGDINGSCIFNGADISSLVNYFRGFGDLETCIICPPIILKKPYR